MAQLGISGTDERKRIHQAQLGISGEVKGKTEAAFGVSGLSTSNNIKTGQVAVAGPNTRPIIGAARNGIAGNLNGRYRHDIVDVGAIHRRDQALANISRESDRLGDRAARSAWTRALWFADFTYLLTSKLEWRKGRQHVFGRQHREIPVGIDSCGYRREITGTAPGWARAFEVYPGAIEAIDPDMYAAWDYPDDRAKTMAALVELMKIFPGDHRLWPIFSARWTWNNDLRLAGNPVDWGVRDLVSLIPLTKTQKQYTRATREAWANVAIANALALANDPDFRFMVDHFGQVMLGGLIKSDCPRSARHLYAATLARLFPGVQFWLLGQANFSVVNGLGRLGLLDQVSVDGTWWIIDATCERFAYVDHGLITMHSFESRPKSNGLKREKNRQTFFTLVEMMAANLRSLLAAYEGLWSWPPPEPLPLDLMDVDQALELKTRYRTAQMELGL